MEWADLVRRKASTWATWTDSLMIPFGDVALPDTVLILLGTIGGEDAFTPSNSEIAFDLSRLYDIYGPATDVENENRIDRFYAHEVTHLLHKAWQTDHVVTLQSPLDVALWDCLVEGLGNYRSLSAKWVSGDGELTEHAHATLDRLQPILVERLVALSTSTDEQAAPLMQGLSSGPFADKWGALTTALWLAQEAAGDPVALQPWVEAGPAGILELARTHLPDSLGQDLSVIELR